MRETHRKRMYWLAALVLSAAIAPPVVFGSAPKKSDREGGDPWRNMIEDFQTLITGFFAVGAAWVTVRQMERSDKKSDDRHNQLVRLTLRADALRLERLVYPQLGELAALERHLRLLNGAWTSEIPPSKYVERHREEIDTIIRKTIGILNQAQWKEGEDLFGGTLTSKVARLRRFAERIVTAFTKIDYDRARIELRKIGQEGRELVEQGTDSLQGNVFHLLSGMEEAMRDVLAGLSALSRFYEIDVANASSGG